MRLLVWLALGLLVYFALRSTLSSSGHATSARQQQPQPGQAGEQGGSQAGAETMVSCDHCGVYIPASEAISQAGHTFCSDEHRLLHRDS
jgi:uncharacterized protein